MQSAWLDGNTRANHVVLRIAAVALAVVAACPLSRRAGAQQPAPSRVAITLDDALRDAREANAHLPVAALNTAIAREQLREARGRGRPAIYLDGDVHAGGPLTYTSSDARVQVIGADTLFSGGRFRAGVRSASFALRAATAGYRVVEKDVDLAVRAQFAEGLHDQQAMRIRDASLQGLRAYLVYLEAQQRGGSGVMADVLRTRTRVAAEEANIADAERAYDAAVVELNVLMGQPPRRPLTLVPLPAPAPPPAPVNEPWRAVPDILSAEASAQSAAAQIAIARADLRPQLSVSADVGRLQPIGSTSLGTGLNTGSGNGAEVTLSFTVPLFDFGHLLQSRLAQAQLAARLAADSATVVRREAERQWASATEQLEDLYHIVQLRGQSVPIARDSYLQAQSLYRGGVGTALDVIDAYSAWVDAQIAEEDAVRDYRQSEAQLIRWGTP